MPFCVAEQAISRGGYKQQTVIIIDSVTQAFYMHEEQKVEELFWKSGLQTDLVSFSCSALY